MNRPQHHNWASIKGQWLNVLSECKENLSSWHKSASKSLLLAYVESRTLHFTVQFFWLCSPIKSNISFEFLWAPETHRVKDDMS